MLNVISAINKNIIAVADEGKNIKRRDVGVKGGDVTEKRNNKKGGKPLINYSN